MTSVPVRSLTVTLSAPPSALKVTNSTPPVSIVMLPGLRKNRSRSPFAERSTVSEAAAPLNTSVSLPSSPSIVSLPSPGSQTNLSSPAPRAGLVTAAVAVDRVVAVAAEERLRARAAGDRVVAVPAFEELADRPRREAGRGDGVVAADTQDEELVGRLLMLDRDLCVEAGHGDAGRVAGCGDRIVQGSAGHDDAVGLAVTRDAAERAREVDVEVLDVGAAEVVDRDRVGAAERVEVDLSTPCVSIVMFAGLRKNRSRSPFAERSTVSEAAAPLNTMVSRAVVALDRVAAVARVPDERVVARAEVRDVVAAVAVDRVVAGTTVEGLRTGTAGDGVVTRTSVDPRRDGVGERTVRCRRCAPGRCRRAP